MNKNRNGEIDLLKFIFAVIIVLFHSANFAVNEEGAIFRGGAIGVDFFFLTSGFLMAGTSSKMQLNDWHIVGPDTMRFMGGKIKRLLPEFYVAWIIAFALKCYMKETGLFETLQNGLLSIYELLFLTQSGLSEFKANPQVWYLSAMLLAMLLLYPLLIKNRALFLHLIAPIIVIFLLGWMYQNLDASLAKPTKWEGFAYRGLLRGIAEIALGCICYLAYVKLKAIKPTRFMSVLMMIIEWGCYLFVIACAFFWARSKVDYIMVLALAVAITISFSQVSLLAGRCRNAVFGWLGAYSYSLFLAHTGWTHFLPKVFPDLNYWQLMPMYLGLSAVTGLIVMYIARFIRKRWPVFISKFKKAMVQAG